MRQKATILLMSAFGLALVLIPTWPAQAQSSTPQEALTQSLAALQKTPTDSALREKIIKLVLAMKRAPAVTEEAKGFMASGTSLFTTAKSPEDFKRAATEFEKATLAAPWLAEAYYNLGSAQEKAGLLYEAAGSLRLYLLAAPKASDAKAVAAHLYGLQQGSLRQFVDDLQRTPSDDALREKIVRLAAGMTPPPALPEEARRHYVMATTLFGAAEKPEDLSGAIDEFRSALLVAPWWPEANHDCGMALKAAQRYDEAIAALKLYLAADPAAESARAAQDEIYKIEAEEARAAAEARKPRFEGTWDMVRWNGEPCEFAYLKGVLVVQQDPDGTQHFRHNGYPVEAYDLRVQGNRIRFCVESGDNTMTREWDLTLSQDGATIEGRWDDLPQTPAQTAAMERRGIVSIKPAHDSFVLRRQ